MKLFKKAAALILGLCAAFTCFFAASCSVSDDGETTIVCTIFPQYDWVLQILGDNPSDINVVYLLDDGKDLHSYSASAEDIKTLRHAELFIYVGGESDESWVDKAISSSKTGALTIALMDEVTVVEEEYVEGMEAEEEDGGDETEYDEHVWLSLRNAQTLVSVIAEKICEIDPENAATYTANANAYNAELAALDGEYAAAVQSAANDTLIFADRFPFKYLVDDYDINYYAAFKGCSSQESASFETLRYLANKLIELDIKHIMVIETSNQTIANDVISHVKTLGGNTSDMDILVLNSCQSVTAADAAAGTNYLDVMKSNLETLKTALN